ncbi:tRNA (adenosine(37)-N6)-threonylcarbamoyltransferase complex transferase subunit TsaD [candidate division KSB1 bacterium]
MQILGIETSCDETAAAVFDGHKLLSNVIVTQEIHKQYGGVVPELASREHLNRIIPVVKEALSKADITLNDLHAVAVTKGPGLVGALLIGVSFAKSLSYSLDIPIIGVNHIEAHLWANIFENPALIPPFIGLIISGGHTQLWLVKGFGDYKLLGQTLDDAVGESFDKTAQVLGLEYPGGPEIDRASKKGDPDFYKFPRPILKSGDYNFSYSGLKTAVLYFVRKLDEKELEEHRNDIAASFQMAAIDSLVIKSIQAAREYKIDKIILGGGVAANSLIKTRFKECAEDENIEVFCPSMEFCTDNAAMIAYLGHRKITKYGGDDLSFSTEPSLKLESS